MHRVIEEIITNNEWRTSEFAKYKRNQYDVEESLWCRMCVPMIYAHWEGFVLDAMRILLNYLNSLELSANSIPVNLLVLSLDDSYKSLSGKQSFQQRIDFTSKFNSSLQNKIVFPKKINTKSNLKDSVLKDICEKMNFDHSKFTDVIYEINSLINIRNSIAHGENSILPSPTKIIQLIDAIQQAMDIFLEEINIFLNQKKYYFLRN